MQTVHKGTDIQVTNVPVSTSPTTILVYKSGTEVNFPTSSETRTSFHSPDKEIKTGIQFKLV